MGENDVVQITREDLSRHYASLSNVELQAIDPQELAELALGCYEKEISRRRLGEQEETNQEALPVPAEHDVTRDWIESAATACSFQVGSAQRYAEDADLACAILRDAGIPSQVVVDHTEDGTPDLLTVMVPGALSLKAASVLDRELFNQEQEETWANHFKELSDKELRSLNADDLCAGLLDRAARLRRVYQEALSQREQ